MKRHKHYRARPLSKRRLWVRRTLFALTILLLLAGLYLLLLVLWPEAEKVTPRRTWNEPVEQVKIEENRLYLPRLQLNLEYKTGDERVLHDYIWHRYPDRGDPEKGGNFILAGHRFEIGFTPAETRRRSPFYHLNRAQEGDYIYADYNGSRYKYQVTRKYTVKPNQVEIEAPSDTPKMTVYTCTLRGEADGREVLEARLIDSNVDPAAELQIN